MTNEQNAFLQMCAAVKATTDSHNSAWATYTSFSTPYTAYLALLPQADDALALQEKTSTGTTEAKSIMRQKLTQKVQQLTDALVQYAVETNNMQLKDDAYMSITSIARLTEKALVGHAVKLKNLLPSPTPASLSAAPANINAAFITDYQTQLTNFTNAIGTPRHIIAESSRGTLELEKIIKLIREKLELMDTAVNVLQYSQSVFYTEYITSRQIIDAGATTRALTVTVQDNDTSEPLQDAEAYITPGDITKLSGAQGKFYIQSMDAGSYNIVIRKANYQNYEASFEIDNAGGTELVAKMIH